MNKKEKVEKIKEILERGRDRRFHGGIKATTNEIIDVLFEGGCRTSVEFEIFDIVGGYNMGSLVYKDIKRTIKKLFEINDREYCLEESSNVLEQM